MERYSDFNDPMTGINPFTNREKWKISAYKILIALLKLPLLLLTYLGINVIPSLIKIKLKNENEKIRGIIAVNSSSIFDKYVLKKVFGRTNLLFLKENIFVDENKREIKLPPKNSIIFVEGCSSNNKAILKFPRDIEVDYVAGLVYSPSCIFMHGNILKFLVHFLASRNSVTIEIKKTKNISELMKVSGLPQVMLGIDEKKKFLELTKK